MISYHLTKSQEDLVSIIKLQQDNLPASLTPEELNEEGFVTLQHDMQLLLEICGSFGHVVAKSNNRLIGYALVMLKEHSRRIPLLESMFDKIEELNQSRKSSYVVMGQICIDKNYRRKGVFRGLYEKMKLALRENFDEILTDVSAQNIRSLNAHEHIGFQVLEKYESDAKEWILISWQINNAG